MCIYIQPDSKLISISNDENKDLWTSLFLSIQPQLYLEDSPVSVILLVNLIRQGRRNLKQI